MTDTVAVVGNGPAGIRAVDSLEQVDTPWISPSTRPTPPACGGVLTAPATDYLKENNLLDSILTSAGQTVDTLVVSAGGKCLLEQEPDNNEIISFYRPDFDRCLMSELNVSSATRRSGYVTDVRELEETVRLELRDGDTIHVDGLIDASGHRQISRPRQTSSNRSLVGVEWHVDDVILPPGELHLLLGDQFYTGFVTTPRGETTVSAVFTTEAFREHQPDGHWQILRRHSPPRLSLPDQPPSSPKTKAGFWNEDSVNAISRRIVRVGDALGFTMPLSGEGIAMAMKEATTAAELITGDTAHQESPFPLTRQTRNRLFEQLVLPYRRQIPRWKRIHWFGRHGSVIRKIHCLFPGLVHWLIDRHKPSVSDW